MAITIKAEPEELDDALGMALGAHPGESVGNLASRIGPQRSLGLGVLPVPKPLPTFMGSPATPGPPQGLFAPIGMPTLAARSAAPPLPAPTPSPYLLPRDAAQKPRRTLFGRIGHIAEEVGKWGAIGAGAEFAPRVMPFIPGTPEHAAFERAQAEREQAEEARSRLEGAQADYEESRANEVPADPESPVEKSRDAIIRELAAKGESPRFGAGSDVTGVSPIAGFPAAPVKHHFEQKQIVGPDGNPMDVNYDTDSGKYYDPATGQVIPNAKAYVKPALPPKPVGGSFNNKPAWAVWEPDKGWLHEPGSPQAGKPFVDFKPSPTWSEVMPGTHTISLTPPGSNIPTVFQYNAATGSYDRKIGTPGGGTYAHQMQQAAASARMIDSVTKTLSTAPVGTVMAWAKSYLLGTPLADPRLAGIDAELMSVAALQPAMHQFRSHTAMQAFEKIVGGLAKNPQATIASLKGLLASARAINPSLQPKAAGAGLYIAINPRDGKRYEGSTHPPKGWKIVRYP